jgi:hypothetical protein
MNELAVNLAAERVDHGNLQFLVVSQTTVAHVLCKFLAVPNRFGVARELNADAVPHRDAVFHIEEKFLHRGLSQSGARSSPDNHPVAFDFSGSGTVTVFMKLYLGHSKMRFSPRSGVGEIRASIMRVWQREQRGRSIAIRDGTWESDMYAPPLDQAGAQYSLSPVNADQGTVMERLCSPVPGVAGQYCSHSKN